VFCGARTTDQYDIVGIIDKCAAMKLADHCFIDLAGSKIEPGEILVGGNRAALI